MNNPTEPQSETPRIYTRCPACGNDTLTINNGHLLCTWVTCPNPCMIDEYASPGLKECDALRAQVATLTREIEEFRLAAFNARVERDNSQKLMSIRYVNYKREYPIMNCFKEWFYIRRYWSGKLVHIGIRHHALVIDLRNNWVNDMMK